MYRPFERLAGLATRWAGSTSATVLAFATIAAWTLGGLWFGYGTDYQMYVNTGTTIVTFLMVFLLQRAQNKEALATHLKLNEIVSALRSASNRLVNVEDLSEAELLQLHERYRRLAERARRTTGEAGTGSP